MASRQHLVEVNRTVRGAGLDEAGADAAVIGFARNLARRLDKVGADDAPLNLLKLYQSALKDLQRAVERKVAAKSPRTRPEPPPAETEQPASPPTLTIVEESPLDRVRRNKAARAG